MQAWMTLQIFETGAAEIAVNLKQFSPKSSNTIPLEQSMLVRAMQQVQRKIGDCMA